jgi:hypothetical protein
MPVVEFATTKGPWIRPSNGDWPPSWRRSRRKSRLRPWPTSVRPSTCNARLVLRQRAGGVRWRTGPCQADLPCDVHDSRRSARCVRSARGAGKGELVKRATEAVLAAEGSTNTMVEAHRVWVRLRQIVNGHWGVFGEAVTRIGAGILRVRPGQAGRQEDRPRSPGCTGIGRRDRDDLAMPDVRDVESPRGRLRRGGRSWPEQTMTASPLPASLSAGATSAVRHAAVAEVAAGPVHRATLYTDTPVQLITGRIQVGEMLAHPGVIKGVGGDGPSSARHGSARPRPAGRAGVHRGQPAKNR